MRNEAKLWKHSNGNIKGHLNTGTIMEGEMSTGVEAGRDMNAESQKHRTGFMLDFEPVLPALTLWAAPQWPSTNQPHHFTGTYTGMLAGYPVLVQDRALSYPHSPLGIHSRNTLRWECTITVLWKELHGNSTPAIKSEADTELYLPDTSDFASYLIIHFCLKYFEHVKHPRAARC